MRQKKHEELKKNQTVEELLLGGEDILIVIGLIGAVSLKLEELLASADPRNNI